ncbi:MAG: hypothetical protein O7H41_12875 [Planctomycetota bacterium]|nr:hypothetical protein [Planctomycetota bacterium]
MSIGYRVPLGAGHELVPYARGRLISVEAEDQGGWWVLAWSGGLTYRLPKIGRFRPWIALEAGWMDWGGYYNIVAGPADGVSPNDRHGYTYGAGIGGDLMLGDRFGIGLELRYERFEAAGEVDADIITLGMTFPISF